MELLTAQELAAQLRLTVDTVWRYTRTGRIPSVRLGPREYRYQLPEVLQSLATVEEEPAAGGYSRPAVLQPTDPARLRAFVDGLRRGDGI